MIAVVGPTAAGKSELSLRLARELDGEVINADSMQLYRGMDIGTGKLAVAERGGVPHHLLDIWDVTEPANVSEYQRLARAVVENIVSRGRTPILVGGSGLYVRAVIDKAAALIPKPTWCFALVVDHEGTCGLYLDTPQEAWKAASALSAQKPPNGVSLVIVDPMVCTMRQPPKSVPSEMAE